MAQRRKLLYCDTGGEMTLQQYLLEAGSPRAQAYLGTRAGQRLRCDRGIDAGTLLYDSRHRA